MTFLLCLICIFSVFAGILLGNAVKTILVMKNGIEGSIKRMLLIGFVCAITAIGLSLASLQIGCTP